MEHKIINRGDYLLIVDDSDIKNYYYDFFINKLKHSNGAEYAKSDIAKQVIAHLPLNNSRILEGVPLLPPLEDDTKLLAVNSFEGCDGCDKNDELFYINGYIKGYNKAKEKYKYTEEDLRKAIDMAQETMLVDLRSDEREHKYTKDEIIQSLQQPKMPVGFKCEMVCENLGCIKMALNGENSVCCGDNMEPKTITNSQGLTQWVGEYVYD